MANKLKNVIANESGNVTIAGIVTATDSGSTGSPTYSFKDNTTTGMLARSTNNLEFVTSGSSALFFFADQSAQFMDNVGIGVAPTTLLNIRGEDPTFTIESNRTTIGTGSSEILGQIDFKTNESSFLNGPATSARIRVDETEFAATTMSFWTSTNPDDTLVKQLEISPTGNASFTGNVNLLDIKKINVGTGNDLQIYHDATDSYIADTGAGDLRILSDRLVINNAADTENMIRATENAGVELFHNAIERLETTSVGVRIDGDLTHVNNQRQNVVSSGTAASYQYLDTRDYMVNKGDYATSTWVVPPNYSTSDHRVSAFEDNTNVYIDDVYYTTIDKMSNTVIAAADVSNFTRITADKPIIVHVDNPESMPINTALSSTKLGAFTNRYHPTTFYMYSPFGKTDVKIYESTSAPVDISGTPTYTTTIAEGAGVTVTGTNHGDTTSRYYVIVSELPICGSYAGNTTSGDYALLSPIGMEILGTAYAADNYWGFNDGTTSSSVNIKTGDTSAKFLYDTTGKNGVFAASTADGAGGDAEFCLPLEYLSDTYIYVHNTITNFRLVSYKSNTIKVLGASDNVLYTIDHTNATKEVPQYHQEGDASGGGADLSNTGPFKFVGSSPFYLVCQEGAEDAETVMLGALQSSIVNHQSFDGGKVPNDTTFAGDVMPAAENAHNIGSASVRWEDLYVDDGYIRNAYIDDYIYHNGDADTYIYFQDDSIKLRAGGTDWVTHNSSGSTFAGSISMNQSNTQVDMTGNSSGNFTIDNNTGNIAFQANGSTVQSMTITSSLITLNEIAQLNFATTINDDLTLNNSSPEMYFKTGSSHYNWMIAAQENVDTALEFTPANAVGSSGTHSSPALTLYANRNATFAGKVTSDALELDYNTSYYNQDKTISAYSASNYVYVNGTGGTDGLGLRLMSKGAATNMIGLENSNNSIFFNTNSTLALTIDSSQNATFAGNVIISGEAQLVSNLTTDNTVIYENDNGTRWQFGSKALTATNKFGGRYHSGSGWSSLLWSINSSGNVAIAGALSKGSGSFKIDHPLESKKDTHDLVHSFIEGPQADLIYRGKVDLVDGQAEVNIDTEAGMTEGTFVLLNTNVQCFTTNESNWDLVKGSVSGNILTIESQNTSSSATISWMVVGERQDQHMIDTDWTDENGKIIVEPRKVE